MFFINNVKGEVLRAILDFMYMGEVHINNEDLIDFIEMAEQFKIRGVTKENSVRTLIFLIIFVKKSKQFKIIFHQKSHPNRIRACQTYDEVMDH